MYGFHPIKTVGHHETITKVVKSGSTVTKYDPVYLEDDTADLAATGEPIFGVAMATVTGDGSLTIPILCGKDIVYEIDNDNDTNTHGDASYGGGKFFDITGTTGAVQIDTSSGTSSGQVVCVAEMTGTQEDPTDTSVGQYKINSAESGY